MNLRWIMGALRRKADLTDELESHLRMAVADRVARGSRVRRRAEQQCVTLAV
jgi:hypothetical protein